jgi:hypothetical protein
MSTAKPIRAGSRKQVQDGLTKKLPLPENPLPDNPLPAEVSQILIVKIHHVNEVQQEQITTKTHVVPAAETEAKVAVEGQEVVAAANEVVPEEGGLRCLLMYIYGCAT